MSCEKWRNQREMEKYGCKISASNIYLMQAFALIKRKLTWANTNKW